MMEQAYEHLTTADLLHTIDFGVIGFYLLLSLVIGTFFAKKATASLEAFFIGDRQMPWWLAGLALTAGAFAADTPLWLGNIIYKRGIEGMWMHWAPGIGMAFFVFTIAPLWRRAGIVTDLEFFEKRYSGRTATVLRGAYSCFYGLIINVMVMAVAVLSITKVLQFTTGWSKELSMLTTLGVAVVYCVLSGVWGVVSTGFMQFIVTMIGFWMLAVFAIFRTGGIGTIVETVGAGDWGGRSLNVLPGFSSFGLPLATILFLFTLRPIEQACAGQALAQRLFSVKSTRDATKVALLFAVIYYALIPLPWIITIIASKAYMPALTDGESAYPIMAMKVLPVGFRGLLIAAMMAAFMSTYSTQLNWGGSYLINDLYKRFIKPEGSARHYALAGQIAAIPMALLSAGLAYTSESVLNLLLYIMTFQAGIWTVNLGRWIWWRVSSISEVAALCGSILMFTGLWIFKPDWVRPSGFEQHWGICMAIIMVGTAAIWIPVTLLTRPSKEEIINEFYRTIQPLGWWKPIRERLGMRSPYRTKSVIYGWVINLVAMYACLIGLIKLVFGHILLGGVLLAVGLAAVRLAFRKANSDPILEESPAADNKETVIQNVVS